MLPGIGALLLSALGNAPKSYYEGQEAQGRLDERHQSALEKAALGNAVMLTGGDGGMGGLASMGDLPGGGQQPPSPGQPSMPMANQWPPQGQRAPPAPPMYGQVGVQPQQGVGGNNDPRVGQMFRGTMGPMPPGVSGQPPQGVPPMAQQPGMPGAGMPGMARPPTSLSPFGQRQFQMGSPMAAAFSPARAAVGPPGAPQPGGSTFGQPSGAMSHPQGGWTWQQLAQRIQRANPGIDGRTMFGALSQAIPLMNSQSQMEFREHAMIMREQNLQLQYDRMRDMMQQLQVRGGQQRDLETARQQGREALADKKAGTPPAQGKQPPGFMRPTNTPDVPATKASLTQSDGSPYEPPDDNPFSAARLGYKLSKADMDHALAIFQYRRPPLQGAFSERDPRQRAIMNAVESLGAETKEPFDQTGYQRRQRGEIAFGTGTQGNQVRFVGTARRHMDTVKELAEALDNDSVRGINAIRNWLTSQGMDPSKVTSFDAAKQIVAAEVIKAVNASGGGVKERLLADQHLDANMPLPAIISVLGAYDKLLEGQLEGFRRQWRAIPGNKTEDFDKKFGIEKPVKPSAPSEDGWKIEPAGP